MPKDEKPPEKVVTPELEQLQKLYNIMLERGLDALELKDDEGRVRLTRRLTMPASAGSLSHHPPPARREGDSGPSGEAPAAPAAETIVTPLAGVFYRASSPTSAPFVKEADVVDPGQTLCIVEAMKVMNEIKAETRCRILRIVAENGRPVTANQPLFEIEPA